MEVTWTGVSCSQVEKATHPQGGLKLGKIRHLVVDRRLVEKATHPQGGLKRGLPELRDRGPPG